MTDLIFLALLALAAYPYLGYPSLLYLLARRRADPTPPPPAAEPPSVCVVTAALNEAEVIEEKVRNLRSLRYPRDRFHAIIGSDGSTDGTVSLARAAAEGDASIEVRDFPVRRGKPAVLREVLGSLDCDVIVLSDANTYFQADALERLTRWFADPDVGCVCGRLVLSAAAAEGRAETAYWGFETTLKQWENRLGAVLGANGGIYAIRRADYEPIADDTVIDDFVLALQIRKKGRRIVFDRTATASEETAPAVRDEFRRRIRIGAGNLQALTRVGSLLRPSAGWTAFAFWSHKVARWFAPVWVLLALAIGVVHADRQPYRGVLVVASAFFVLAAIGWGYERAGIPARRAFGVPYAFCASNLALVLGLFRFLRGRQDARWARTRRSASPALR